MAKASPKNIRARNVVLQYCISASLACELKCLDSEGNFSPHTVHAYALVLGRCVGILIDTFGIEQYKARKIAQRILLTWLQHSIKYPVPNEKEWLSDQCMLSPLKEISFGHTLDSVKPTCLYRIKQCNASIDLDRAWNDIVEEVRHSTETWLMNDDPFEISKEGLQAYLCLLVSKFYGLIKGKAYERKESVSYFLEREVQDYITEEGLEINYVLQQRNRKKSMAASQK